MRPTSVLTLGLLTACVLAARPATAEFVIFRTGRTMSVAGHRMAGESVILVLRGGGEIECDRAVVDRIEPDEIPIVTPAAATSGGSSELRLLIRAIADAEGVEAALVDAVIAVESAYQHDAQSPRGALGLMQLMPATALEYAVTDPFDTTANITGGVRHLRRLLDRYDDLTTALAAYNAGEGAVERYGGIPPYPETRTYVSRILARLRRDR